MNSQTFQDLMHQMRDKERYVKYKSGKIVGPVRGWNMTKLKDAVTIKWWRDGLETFSFLPMVDVMEVGVLINPHPFSFHGQQSCIIFFEEET